MYCFDLRQMAAKHTTHAFNDSPLFALFIYKSIVFQLLFALYKKRSKVRFTHCFDCN